MNKKIALLISCLGGLLLGSGLVKVFTLLQTLIIVVGICLIVIGGLNYFKEKDIFDF